MKRQVLALGVAVLVIGLLAGGGAPAKAMSVEAGWYGSTGFNLAAYMGMGENMEVGASVSTSFLTLGGGVEGRYLLSPFKLEFLPGAFQPYAFGRADVATTVGVFDLYAFGGVGARYALTDKLSIWESLGVGPRFLKTTWGDLHTGLRFITGGGFRYDF